MKRVIYSLYIDIPSDQLDNQNPYFWDSISKSERTKISLKENYDRLLSVKQQYSKQINVDFKMFEYDQAYQEYEQYFAKHYPDMSSYNVVNFYKIHLLYRLAQEYDEINASYLFLILIILSEVQQLNFTMHKPCYMKKA